MSLAESIKREAATLGFDAVGISRVEAMTDTAPDSPERERRRRLTEWLRLGYHGLMAWMAREPERRSDPTRVLPGCRSIVSLGLNYYSGHRADERPGFGRIARYAWGEDYHRVFSARLAALEDRIRRLAPDARTRAYVDTGPVMEKAWAEQAGLGWIGKHSNLVSPRFGSWLLLGEILTTLDLPADEPGADLCGSCTLCIKACPTGAIAEAYVVDARRCIAYLTIELHKPGDAIPDDLAPKLGNRIFGCDDCLDVCPYNAQASPTSEPAFQPSPDTLAPNLEALSALDQQAFAARFRTSPIRRATHGGLRRNVALALKQTSSKVPKG